MSLEAAITENTSAVRELIALLSVGVVIDKVKKPASDETKPTKKVKAEPKSETETPAAETKAAAPETGEEAAGTSDAPTVTYEDVSAAIVALHRAKGRDAALGVLKEFGLEHAREATEDQWAGIVEAARAEMD